MRVLLLEAKKQISGLKDFSEAKFSAEFSHTLLEFVLTFSVFESIFDDNKKFLAKKPYKQIEPGWTKPFFDFFVKRYVTDGSMDPKFASLFQDQRDDEQWVREKLLNPGTTSETDMFLVVFKISYRFRNNLLHGNMGKAVRELDQYDECFKKIIEFMLCLIGKLVELEDKTVAARNG